MGSTDSDSNTSKQERLEFAGGIAVDLARADYDRVRDTKDWLIEFPRESLRVL